jgi:hypothetical protein
MSPARVRPIAFGPVLLLFRLRSVARQDSPASPQGLAFPAPSVGIASERRIARIVDLGIGKVKKNEKRVVGPFDFHRP